MDEKIRYVEATFVSGRPRSTPPLSRIVSLLIGSRIAVFAANFLTLETAGWAPFHFPRGVDGIAEPWRAYVLRNTECRALSTYLSDELQLSPHESRNLQLVVPAIVTTGYRKMLTQRQQCDEPAVIRNEEHLAATAALICLLSLTARGMGTTGRAAESSSRLRSLTDWGSRAERLIGAIFIGILSL